MFLPSRIAWGHLLVLVFLFVFRPEAPAPVSWTVLSMTGNKMGMQCHTRVGLGLGLCSGRVVVDFQDVSI